MDIQKLLDQQIELYGHNNVDKVMDAMDRFLHGFGVEAIHSEYTWVSHYYGDITALYVNMGDTYDTTVLYDTEENEYHVTTWGDWYEGTEDFNRSMEEDQT